MDPNIYKTALVIHVVGITIMAGTTFIDFIAFRYFWKIFGKDKTKSLVLKDALLSLQRFTRIGLLVIVASGVLMMAYLHQVWGEQIWFRIKMGMLLLIVINGLAVRRSMGLKFKKVTEGELTDNNLNTQLPALRKNITISQVLQMLFFIIIFVLSIFKFN
jgi:hypothetical protein